METLRRWKEQSWEEVCAHARDVIMTVQAPEQDGVAAAHLQVPSLPVTTGGLLVSCTQKLSENCLQMHKMT